MIEVATPQLGGRTVLLRPGTADEQVWADTFTGLYHVPPDSMPPPSTVVDLGANIGLTAAHYAWLWPSASVVAVEMDAGNAWMALSNAWKAQVFVYAVSDVEGVIRYDPTARQDAFRVGSGPARAYALPLEQIIERWAGGHADFVKMDVEGAEWTLFKDEALARWAPLVGHLLVELHQPAGVSACDASSEELVDAAIERLRRAGFNARRHDPHPQAVWATRR